MGGHAVGLEAAEVHLELEARGFGWLARSFGLGARGVWMAGMGGTQLRTRVARGVWMGGTQLRSGARGCVWSLVGWHGA